MKAVGLSRLLTPVLAALALAYLAVMVVNGALPRQRQLVKFEAKGVLRIEPELVRLVTLSRGGRQAQLLRSAEGGWTLERGGAVGPEVARHLETAVKMLHRSPPVREIAPEELAGVDRGPFGLGDPSLLAALAGPGGPVLSVRFGAHNPEGFLQYMAIEGDPKLYLMSRFIGAEWLAAFDGMEVR
jgi:hypothetical protein